MNKVLIVHTSWYADYINEMIKLSCKVLSENKFSWDISLAPGSIELPALAKHKLIKNKGRILVRKSGTEPKIRIMGESNNISLLKKCINIVKRSIK